jgi:putative transposase
MALDDSVLSELLEMFRAGDGLDLVRESVRVVLQELIEVQAADVIGARRTSALIHARRSATGTGPGCWPPRPGMWS